MAKGHKTGGRKAGTPNKVTAVAKDVISGAADDMGGRERLVAWAKEDPANERIFWGSIFTKLIGIVGADSGLRKLVCEWQEPPSES